MRCERKPSGIYLMDMYRMHKCDMPYDLVCTLVMHGCDEKAPFPDALYSGPYSLQAGCAMLRNKYLCRILEAGAFSPFETACMVNLLPENAEEAKALIPSLAVSSLQEVELVYSLQQMCLATTWATVMHCSAHNMAVWLYGGRNGLSGFKKKAMLPLS